MISINKDVRVAAFQANVRLWQIAKRIGIGEATLSRWLRSDLSPEKRKLIYDAIEDIKADM